MEKYLTKKNISAALILVAAGVAYALGELDLNGFIALVNQSLGG